MVLPGNIAKHQNYAMGSRQAIHLCREILLKRGKKRRERKKGMKRKTWKRKAKTAREKKVHVLSSFPRRKVVISKYFGELSL